MRWAGRPGSSAFTCLTSHRPSQRISPYIVSSPCTTYQSVRHRYLSQSVDVSIVSVDPCCSGTSAPRGQENDSWNARVRRGTAVIVGAPPPFAEQYRSGWIYWNAFMARRTERSVPRTAVSLDGLAAPTERTLGTTELTSSRAHKLWGRCRGDPPIGLLSSPWPDDRRSRRQVKLTSFRLHSPFLQVLSLSSFSTDIP